MIVLAAFISPQAADRQAARLAAAPAAFVEVFVDCPLAECERRDPKQLYRRARAGELAQLTGVSAPTRRPRLPRSTCAPTARRWSSRRPGSPSTSRSRASSRRARGDSGAVVRHAQGHAARFTPGGAGPSVRSRLRRGRHHDPVGAAGAREGDDPEPLSGGRPDPGGHRHDHRRDPREGRDPVQEHAGQRHPRAGQAAGRRDRHRPAGPGGAAGGGGVLQAGSQRLQFRQPGRQRRQGRAGLRAAAAGRADHAGDRVRGGGDREQQRRRVPGRR